MIPVTMSLYYSGKRIENLFDPTSAEPYNLAGRRSQILRPVRGVFILTGNGHWTAAGVSVEFEYGRIRSLKKSLMC